MTHVYRVNGLEGCAVYLRQRGVVYSNTGEDNLSLIHALFDPLADGNLTVNLENVSL